GGIGHIASGAIHDHISKKPLSGKYRPTAASKLRKSSVTMLQSPNYVPIPPSIARLQWRDSSLRRDDLGRPVIRIFLGGGGFIGHWGVVIGHKDMPTPPSDFSDNGEIRCPLAPGAYVWYSE
ncbi:MAG: hypothetical protein KBE65_14970, partial [Phycisphaerae bacterium]|nr:hypothetical protein [Phycisphaerae bacterium]